jgi:hypothetical protein
MINTLNVSRGRAHANTLEYKGTLSKYQTEGNHKYQTTNDILKYQDLLYNRAMFGLGVYSSTEIKAMTSEKRKRIVKVHKRTKKVINIWKQELIVTLSNHIFKTFFPNMPLSQEFLNDCEKDPEYHCNFKLQDLGITKQDIILKLLQEKILPQNTFNLNPL